MMHFDMPMIVDCAALKCAYNRDKQCNAVSITVGGPGDKCACCDTEMYWKSKAGVEGQPGEVGACHMADCQHNCSLECTACDGIKVDVHAGHADCATYKKK